LLTAVIATEACLGTSWPLCTNPQNGDKTRLNIWSCKRPALQLIFFCGRWWVI